MIRLQVIDVIIYMTILKIFFHDLAHNVPKEKVLDTDLIL